MGKAMDLSLAGILLRLAIGLIIGFCIGLTGVGGGVLVMPALIVLLDMDSSRAVGTTSLYAFLTKIYAAIMHFRLKTIDFAVSLWFLIGAIPADIAVSCLINRQAKLAETTANAAPFQDSLKRFITWVVLFSAVMLIVNLIRKSRRSPSSFEKELKQSLPVGSWQRRALAVFMGAIVGGLIGSTSVGGGVLIVPVLIVFFGLTASRTVGTSIFVAVVLTLLTSIVYGQGDQLDAWTSIIMAVGSLAGVYGGSRLSVKLPEKALQIIVIVLIVVASVAMLCE